MVCIHNRGHVMCVYIHRDKLQLLYIWTHHKITLFHKLRDILRGKVWNKTLVVFSKARRPFAKFVDWWQCVAVMQREAVTVMPSCSGEGNIIVA
jgi:hypothetical protein